jgi:dihydroorotate dehydrogenase
MKRAQNPEMTLENISRLEVSLLGTTYSSPLAVASGTLVERFEQIEPFLEAGAGAVIPRSIPRYLTSNNVFSS